MTGYESKKAMAQAKLAQPAQELVAWAVYDKRGGSKSLHWPEQHSPDGDANTFDAVPLVPQRPWVGLTNEDCYEFAKAQLSWDELLIAAETKLKEKNT